MGEMQWAAVWSEVDAEEAHEREGVQTEGRGAGGEEHARSKEEGSQGSSISKVGVVVVGRVVVGWLWLVGAVDGAGSGGGCAGEGRERG